jgi:predicted RNase H-like HicB family nuclease
MNSKYFYPSLFHKAEEGGYWVSFPDLPECFTQGDNIDEAYRMSVDALGLALEDRIKANDVPAPSPVENIAVEENAYVVIIEFDLLEYKKRTASKAVKKTLSIPCWLNEAATERGINFSAVLQDALKERLGV